jgi:hypothetical protein
MSLRLVIVCGLERVRGGFGQHSTFHAEIHRVPLAKRDLGPELDRLTGHQVESLLPCQCRDEQHAFHHGEVFSNADLFQKRGSRCVAYRLISTVAPGGTTTLPI